MREYGKIVRKCGFFEKFAELMEMSEYEMDGDGKVLTLSCRCAACSL